MLFKLKGTVKVDMYEMPSERENLSNFLLKHFKLKSSMTDYGLELKMEEVSTHALVRMVTKFIYQYHLNSTFWVNCQNNVVKVNRFAHKKEKKKNKNAVTASTISHGW